jgi:O-antigen ligase
MGVRTRVFSILDSPNVMGSFMVMIAPICVGFTYKARNMLAKILLWGGAGIMCLACVFTFSRGAWLGMAVAVFIFSLYRDRRLLGLAALCAGIAVFIPEIANRITYLFTSDFAEASAAGGRTQRWTVGMDLLIKNKPWLGFGLGRFGGAVAMQNQVIEGLDYFYMDNYYLKTLVEMGYLGFAAYLLLIFSFLWNGMRSIFRVHRGGGFDLEIGVFAGLCGVLAHCLFENIFEVPYMNAYFWGLAAFLIWAGFLRKGRADGLKPRVL